ncbi:MAG: DUF5692 family protein, partial [Sphaerochaeta sp.]
MSSYLMLIAIFCILILLNEISRRSQAGGFILFIILPLFLT